MKFSVITKEILRIRRARRSLMDQGYEEVGESGGLLWELARGPRMNHVITDVRIGPDGKTLFIKIARRSAVKIAA